MTKNLALSDFYLAGGSKNFSLKRGVYCILSAMRIISGTKKGMNLFSPDTMESRPYTDRVKESVFDVLFKYGLIENRRVADVFCGVGSMGLEALSRGARAATFVEKDSRIIETLRKNIEKCGFVTAASVVRANAFKVGAPLGFDEEKFSLIFIDPPYPLTQDVAAGSRFSEIMKVLPDQIADDGLILVRTHRNIELTENYQKLEIIDRRVWGNMAVAILRLKKNDQ